MSVNLQTIKQRFGIIGTSRLLDVALDTAARVAPTDLSVLIQGESGVGKEVFSKIIHALSPRKHNAFIAVNCGAIPEGTINSELFGHEKGSFTGAVSDRKGYFETVNGGTIFLDEIGEMPLDTQAFLLRVLENGEFMRVGSSKVEKTDVRIIAATNVNLESAIRKGKFREDLYYRLNTVPIKVPSLKERRDDIYMLFRKFSADFAEKYRMQPVILDDHAQVLIENYPFPGNIRELKNIAEQLSILSTERQIHADLLMDLMPHLLNRNLPARTTEKDNEPTTFHERELLYKVMLDLRNDMTELKKLIIDLIKSNNLNIKNLPNISVLLGLNAPQNNTDHTPQERFSEFSTLSNGNNFVENFGHRNINTPPSVGAPLTKNLNKEFTEVIDYQEDFNKNYSPARRQTYDNYEKYEQQPIQPIILEKPIRDTDFNDAHEIIEENLSLAEMEKRQILKALKKHNNRRKEAADDLGISERTLYRKIKEYDLD